MDSMKRSEANSGHHQNKVVLTNQETDSNNKVNLSGSNLNNNTVSNKQQHQSASLNPNQTPGAQVSTPSSIATSSVPTNSDINKDSNFEYDDNEWDVGIGDLIIDLDADIEKSSVTSLLHNQPGTNLIKPSSPTPVLLSSVSTLNTLTSDSTSNVKRTQSSNVSKKDPEQAGENFTRVNISNTSVKGETSNNASFKVGTTSSIPFKPNSSSFSSTSSFASGHHHHHHHHHKSHSIVDSGNRNTSNLSKHSALLSQLNCNNRPNTTTLSAAELSGLIHHHSSESTSSNSSNSSADPDSKISRSSSSSTMSSTTSGSGGKSATKLAVDHQATLDKGLKMKIKRTKPGTKTSEAKHEIVKAEQNGTSSLTSSNADENNSNSNSSSNSSNKKHSSQSQSQAQQQIASPNMSQQQQQGTKRGSSGHRRDKTKEKTTHHNQRDKTEHNSNNSGSSTVSSGDRGCSCTHEMQVNGIQQPCSSITCIRNRTSDQSISSLSQRLSNQNNSSTSTSNSIFSSNSNTGTSLSSSNNTPNAPGPPSSKDGNKISSTAAANNSQLSNLQHSTSSSGSSSGGSSNNSSSSSGNNSSSTTSGTSNSSNNVLKSQLQSSTPPSNLLNALSTVTSATASPNNPSTSNNSVSTGAPTIGGDSSVLQLKDEKSSTSPPPAKRYKCDPKDMVDVCVGTSVGTITEPDCLGPCEPGTSVTLEGIVWHETEGGVLVVNVTWRGKTYVGTLIDCTKHDWAPPRFCDSPTEEFDSRTPKGRAKRSRNSTLFPVNDLSNFTETRSSMHSKLRNGGSKGRGGRATTTAESSSSKTTTTSTTTTANLSSATCTTVSSNTPSTSPVAFLPPRSEKRKSKDEPPSPVNSGNGNSSSSSGSVINSSSVSNTNASGIVNNGTQSTQSVVNPMTGLNVQISTKKCKSIASPCAVSPVLLECPEQDCSKKYKHANGLRYHQSHAHGSVSSMDEDSSHPPESPQRVAPPTTPSPLPTVQTPVLLNSVPSTTTTALLPISSNPPSVTTTAANNSPQVAATIGGTPNASQIAVITTSTTPNIVSNASPCSVSSPNLLMTVNVSTTTSNVPTTHSLLTTTTQSLSTTPQVSSQHSAPSPVLAGGSITTGIAGQAQQHSGIGNTSTLLSTALASSQNISSTPVPVSAQSIPNQVQMHQQAPQQQQQQQTGPVSSMTTNSIAANPARCDTNTKTKPSVLRFGQLPGETEHSPRLSSIAQGTNNIIGTPGSVPAGAPPSTPLRPAAIGISTGLLAMQPATPGTPDGLSIKSQSCTKQKKSRKSPGPTEYDVTANNRAEDVQSPAYSDISDDSTPVVDPGDLEKSKGPQLPDAAKKPTDNVSGQLGPLSSYGMYPYYPSMPHQPPYYASEHSGKPSGLGHSPLGPNATVDYKSKEPPLDLMNKANPHQQQQSTQPVQPAHSQQLSQGEPGVPPSKDGSVGPPTHSGAGKMMQHFYPYGYMPTGFGYNLEPNYGPVSMIQEDNKLGQQQPPGQIKEERIKENPSPNEYSKMGPQVVPTKLIKTEPITAKDIKTESGHTMHPKDQHPSGQPPGQPPIGAYGGIFQRHGLNVGPPPQPPQHINREDDLRRLFNYSDQRRSSTSSNSSLSNMNTKEEPPSPSQPQPGHPGQGSAHNQPTVPAPTNSSQPPPPPQQQKGSKNTPSTQQQIKQQKDIKTEDKEMLKIKQEGQKPTMETQGPPPPPTSQYYPHSLYMSAAPFGFDPNHQMYRNMLVPTASYSAPPYHLQIPRYTTPEDLSRNPNTKALDLLQHHASQYYNSHKIHELREGALKSPNSSVKTSVSSPNLTQQQSNQNPNMCIAPPNSNIGASGLSLQQQQQQQQPPPSHTQQSQQVPPLQPPTAGGPNTVSGPGSGVPGGPGDLQKDAGGPGVMGQCSAPQQPTAQQPGQPSSGNRSPPPQRHVHTHHHTHVGLGYPMFQAPYGAAVLASQQAAAAVTVISPFQTGPPAK